MDIILLEKIENVGSIGDRVKVKSGYARNFLIPQGKATLATPENLAKFESIRVDLEKKAADELAAAQARASQLENKEVRLTVQAGPEGKLFGSIGTIDIANACAALGIEIERSEVRMPDGPLRVTGEHEVELHFHTDVNIPLKVILESNDPTAAASLLDADEEPDSDDE